jgi:hypothetical protein
MEVEFTARQVKISKALRAQVRRGWNALPAYRARLRAPVLPWCAEACADCGADLAGAAADDCGYGQGDLPQGLKPSFLLVFCGTTEVVPFQSLFMPPVPGKPT